MTDQRALENRLRAVRLHQLEGFYFVGLHQGFTRAADAMPYPITEPALHQQVRKLERALGPKLLVRGSGRRMVLTPEGRRIHAFITPYFERLPAVLREVAGGEAGEVVVAAEALYMDALAAPALSALRARRPLVRARLIEAGGLDEIAGALRRGSIDGGLAGIVAVPADLAFRPLGRLGMALHLPPGHALAGRRAPLRAKDLEGLAVVAYEKGSEARRYADQALAKAGLAVQVAAEASSAAAMRALVRAGVAPAFVPWLNAAGRPRRRTADDGVVTFDLTELARHTFPDLPQYGLLLRAGEPPSPIVDVLAEVLGKVAAR